MYGVGDLSGLRVELVIKKNALTFYEISITGKIRNGKVYIVFDYVKTL